MGIINGLPYNGGTGSVIDSLESDSRSSALSAYQGKLLLQKIAELEKKVQQTSSIGVSNSDRLETSEIEENVARINFYLNGSDKAASSEIPSGETDFDDDNRYVTTEIENENVAGSSISFNENDKVETEEIVTEDA